MIETVQIVLTLMWHCLINRQPTLPLRCSSCRHWRRDNNRTGCRRPLFEYTLQGKWSWNDHLVIPSSEMPIVNLRRLLFSNMCEPWLFKPRHNRSDLNSMLQSRIVQRQKRRGTEGEQLLITVISRSVRWSSQSTLSRQFSVKCKERKYLADYFTFGFTAPTSRLPW